MSSAFERSNKSATSVPTVIQKPMMIIVKENWRPDKASLSKSDVAPLTPTLPGTS